jgi:hypothetical protein
MTARKNRSSKPAAPSDVQVTPEEGRIESPVIEIKTESSAPVNIETETPSAALISRFLVSLLSSSMRKI